MQAMERSKLVHMCNVVCKYYTLLRFQISRNAFSHLKCKAMFNRSHFIHMKYACQHIVQM